MSNSVRRSRRVLGTNRGFAIVLVLAVLVLMLTAELAIFSRAQTSRLISASSAANRQVDLLADAAVGIVESDLLHEIRAGSSNPALPAAGTRANYQPRTTTIPSLTLLGSSIGMSGSPSMMPSRNVADSTAPSTLLKQSRHGTPFFSQTNGVVNASPLPSIPDRAAAVSTADAPVTGRPISTNVWNAPRFADASAKSRKMTQEGLITC